MLLDENLVEDSKDVTTCVNIDTLQLEDINLEEINLDFKTLVSNKHSTVESFDLQKEEVEKQGLCSHPLEMEETCDQMLESPISNVYLDGNVMMHDLTEEEMNKSIDLNIKEMEILSPSTTHQLKSKFRKEESTFSDLLLMLLPVPENQNHLTLPSLNLSSVHQLHLLNLDAIFNLNWDPLKHAESLMVKVSKGCLSKLRKMCGRGEPISMKDFKLINIKNDEVDVAVDDWKVEERKLQSFQYITSYKKSNPQTDCGVPTNKQFSIAPKGYHGNHIVDKKRYIPPQKKHSDKIMDLSAISPQLTKIFQSPLDSFVALRTGKLKLPKRSIAHVHPVSQVSAAKVLPMVNESLNKKQKLNKINSFKEQQIIEASTKYEVLQHKTNTEVTTNSFKTPSNNYVENIRMQSSINDSGFDSSSMFKTPLDTSEVAKQTEVPNVKDNNKPSDINQTMLSNVNATSTPIDVSCDHVLTNQVSTDQPLGIITSKEFSNNDKSLNNKYTQDIGVVGYGSTIESVETNSQANVSLSNRKHHSSNPAIMIESDVEGTANYTKNIPVKPTMFDTKGNDQTSYKEELTVKQHSQERSNSEVKNNAMNQHFVQNVIEVCHHETLSVTLPEQYTKVIKAIVKESISLIQFLKDTGRIDKASLLGFTKDETRFLLKEEEKKMENGKSEKDVLRGIICLHGLTTVLHLLVVYDIPTSCSFLKTYSLKYKDILRNCLQPVCQKLLNYKDILHPKYEKLLALIKEWLVKQNDIRILILIDDYYEVISSSMKNYFTLNNIQVNLYPTVDLDEQTYMQTFVDATVILAHETNELQACPWKFFQHVVQFQINLEDKSHWYEVATKENACLKSFVSLETECCNFNEKLTDTNSTKNEIQHTILCSKDIIAKKELLIQLESKQNMRIFVKDYSKLPFTAYQADIWIDERTCVLVVCSNDVSHENEGVLEERILSCVMKSTVCHVVLVVNEKQTSGERLSHVTSISSMIGQIKQAFQHVHCKLWHAHSTTYLSSLIKQLCDTAYQSCKVWTKEQWVNRDKWLKEEISKQEIFLLSYPCMNSLCAQIMLQACGSLDILMKLGEDDLINVFSWIPQHVLQSFYKTNHHSPTIYNGNNFNPPHENIIISDEENMDPNTDVSLYPESRPMVKNYEETMVKNYEETVVKNYEETMVKNYEETMYNKQINSESRPMVKNYEEAMVKNYEDTMYNKQRNSENRPMVKNYEETMYNKQRNSVKTIEPIEETLNRENSRTQFGHQINEQQSICLTEPIEEMISKENNNLGISFEDEMQLRQEISFHKQQNQIEFNQQNKKNYLTNSFQNNIEFQDETNAVPPKVARVAEIAEMHSGECKQKGFDVDNFTMTTDYNTHDYNSLLNKKTSLSNIQVEKSNYFLNLKSNSNNLEIDPGILQEQDNISPWQQQFAMQENNSINNINVEQFIKENQNKENNYSHNYDQNKENNYSHNYQNNDNNNSIHFSQLEGSFAHEKLINHHAQQNVLDGFNVSTSALKERNENRFSLNDISEKGYNYEIYNLHHISSNSSFQINQDINSASYLHQHTNNGSFHALNTVQEGNNDDTSLQQCRRNNNTFKNHALQFLQQRSNSNRREEKGVILPDLPNLNTSRDKVIIQDIFNNSFGKRSTMVERAGEESNYSKKSNGDMENVSFDMRVCEKTPENNNVLRERNFNPSNLYSNIHKKSVQTSRNIKGYHGGFQNKTTWSRNSPRRKANIPRQSVMGHPHVKGHHSVNGMEAHRHNPTNEMQTPKYMAQRLLDPPNSISLSASKRRRLTYEKVPGATNGQTRLTFL